MRKSLIALALISAAADVFALPGEINGIQGDVVWSKRQKTYTVTYKKGKTDVTGEFPLADVTSLNIQKPKGYDAAVQAVEAGQGASAIPALKKMTEDYSMMVWDKPAGRYLALAYIAAGKPQMAYDLCRSMIDEDKKAAYTGALAPAYWTSLMKLGKKDVLEKVLQKAATSGDRASAAAATLMRGDMILDEQGDKGLKDAITQGYLRVALMYTDAACTDVRREALVKCANAFDKLGQAARAEKLRNQAKEI